MSSKKVFSTRGSGIPAATATNEAGGKAYSRSPKAEIAQIVTTGTFGQTFYISPQNQLDRLLTLVNQVGPRFVAAAAVYGRKHGFMKDTPAFILAALAARAKTDPEAAAVLKTVFPLVIDNGRMARNFAQIIRSNVTGRRSFGSMPKRLLRQWLAQRTVKQLLADSVGNDPSIADVIRMIHPSTKGNKEREALYGWLIGKEVNEEVLPQLVRDLLAYRRGATATPPDVEFRLLTAQELPASAWTEIAKNAPWHATRMNLNTFQRHKVLDDVKMLDVIADRLRDPVLIKKSRVFPYQLLIAYRNTTEVPVKITNALQDALDISLENIPQIHGKVVVAPDVSGSMGSPVTGDRGTATTKVRYSDISSLVASAFLRANPDTRILPFEYRVHNIRLNPRDSVVTNTNVISRLTGGGTDVAAPLVLLNSEQATADLVVIVSDNESWLSRSRGHGTGLMEQWEIFKRRNRNAKLVLIDISPSTSAQAVDRPDILNIGGFSDSVFTLLAEFHRGRFGADYWVQRIEELSSANGFVPEVVKSEEYRPSEPVESTDD